MDWCHGGTLLWRLIMLRNRSLQRRNHLCLTAFIDSDQDCSTSTMASSRRGSGTLLSPTGQTIPFFTRVAGDEELPHATKKWVVLSWTETGVQCWSCDRTMADHLRKFESLYVLEWHALFDFLLVDTGPKVYSYTPTDEDDRRGFQGIFRRGLGKAQPNCRMFIIDSRIYIIED